MPGREYERPSYPQFLIAADLTMTEGLDSAAGGEAHATNRAPDKLNPSLHPLQ